MSVQHNRAGPPDFGGLGTHTARCQKGRTFIVPMSVGDIYPRRYRWVCTEGLVPAERG